MILLLLFLGFFGFVAQPFSHAYQVQGEWTSLFWNREVPAQQDDETRWQIYESLRGHLRVGDASLHVHTRISRLDDWESRLYQGYLDYRLARLKLRLGRQFVPNDVGFWQMDGLRASYRHRSLRADLYGGTATTPWGRDRSGILGLDLSWVQVPFSRIGPHFVAILDGDSVQRFIVGGQVGTLGGSLPGVHRTAELPVQLYGRANVDVISRTFVSGLGYASMGPRWGKLYGEYQRETPLFAEDSIFTVFAVEPWEQVAAGLELRPRGNVALDMRYARQFYDAGPLHRYRAGVRVGPLASYLERIEDDFVEYWRVRSQVQMTYGSWEAQISHYYNNYRRSLASSMESAYSYQLRLRYQIGRQLHLMLRLEDNINPDFEYNVRGLGSLRWRFGWRG